MAEVARAMGISGIMDDLPGKLMALRGIVDQYDRRYDAEKATENY